MAIVTTWNSITNPYSGLIQMEAADILRRCGVGRAADKRGEAPDVTNVVLPCVGAKTPHEHVVLHALAKRRQMRMLDESFERWVQRLIHSQASQGAG